MQCRLAISPRITFFVFLIKMFYLLYIFCWFPLTCSGTTISSMRTQEPGPGHQMSVNVYAQNRNTYQEGMSRDQGHTRPSYFRSYLFSRIILHHIDLLRVQGSVPRNWTSLPDNLQIRAPSWVKPASEPLITRLASEGTIILTGLLIGLNQRQATKYSLGFGLSGGNSPNMCGFKFNYVMRWSKSTFYFFNNIFHRLAEDC